MNLTLIIILCVLIAFVLILFPLIISRKAEKASKIDEWDKIKEFAKKINDRAKRRKNKY